MRASSSVHQEDIIRAARGAERGSVSRIWTGPRRAGSSTFKAEAMEDKEREKKDKNSSDRVTLKKEIGLLSACAIIIGECVTAFVLNKCS